MVLRHMPMDQHPLGIRQPVMHACPEHAIGQAPPLCPVCLGTGLVSDERLARYQADQDRLMR